MKMKDKGEKFLFWITGEIFTTGVFAFSMDLFKAFLFGIVGGLGGLLVKIAFNKYNETRNGKK